MHLNLKLNFFKMFLSLCKVPLKPPLTLILSMRPCGRAIHALFDNILDLLFYFNWLRKDTVFYSKLLFFNKDFRVL